MDLLNIMMMKVCQCSGGGGLLPSTNSAIGCESVDRNKASSWSAGSKRYDDQTLTPMARTAEKASFYDSDALPTVSSALCERAFIGPSTPTRAGAERSALRSRQLVNTPPSHKRQLRRLKNQYNWLVGDRTESPLRLSSSPPTRYIFSLLPSKH